MYSFEVPSWCRRGLDLGMKVFILKNAFFSAKDWQKNGVASILINSCFISGCGLMMNPHFLQNISYHSTLHNSNHVFISPIWEIWLLCISYVL